MTENSTRAGAKGAQRVAGELRQAQAELETSRARYFDLYDLAPVG